MAEQKGWWAVYVEDDFGDMWLIALYSAERYERCQVEAVHGDHLEDEDFDIKHMSTIKGVKLKNPG